MVAEKFENYLDTCNKRRDHFSLVLGLSRYCSNAKVLANFYSGYNG